MIKVKPSVNPQGRYQISDTAGALEVHISTVDRWTRAGIMKCGIRRTNGRRVWTGEEIIRVWQTMM